MAGVNVERGLLAAHCFPNLIPLVAPFCMRKLVDSIESGDLGQFVLYTTKTFETQKYANFTAP